MRVTFQQVCVATRAELQKNPELLEVGQHQLKKGAPWHAPQGADGSAEPSHHWLRMCDEWCDLRLPMHVHAVIQKQGIRDLKAKEIPVRDEMPFIFSFSCAQWDSIPNPRRKAALVLNYQWYVRCAEKLQSEGRDVERARVGPGTTV